MVAGEIRSLEGRTMLSVEEVEERLWRFSEENKKVLGVYLKALGYFGSYAFGEATEESDLDIIVIVDKFGNRADNDKVHIIYFLKGKLSELFPEVGVDIFVEETRFLEKLVNNPETVFRVFRWIVSGTRPVFDDTGGLLEKAIEAARE